MTCWVLPKQQCGSHAYRSLGLGCNLMMLLHARCTLSTALHPEMHIWLHEGLPLMCPQVPGIPFVSSVPPVLLSMTLAAGE